MLVYAFTGTVVKEAEDRFTNDIFLQISNADELLAWQPLDILTRTN